jgi:condensin complex subunit 2
VAESAEEVAEMYRTVIKMASENKINMKNAWSLSLIDHMRDVVNDEEEEKEEDVPKDVRRCSYPLRVPCRMFVSQERRGSVNFQRASCTLDAGVKIYCSRVDDTWATSLGAASILREKERAYARKAFDNGGA